MTPTQYQLSLNSAIWVDVNSQVTLNGLPDRLPDAQAVIVSSLYNLFNCVPGERSRTFQPTYGSAWRQFIHEPISPLTSAKMEMFMIEAIRKWEPRISLDLSATSVDPDTSLPGYRVRIAFSMPGMTVPTNLQFLLPV